MRSDTIERLGILDTLPVSAWPYPRVLLGVPTESAISHADSVWWNFMNISGKNGVDMLALPHMPIELYRNFAARDFLTTNYTHLLMMDIDHKHPVDIAQRLCKWVVLYPEVRIVSALAFMRQKPHSPVMGPMELGASVPIQWPSGLVEVEHPSTAAILIHRSVFEELEPPWFFRMYDKVWENAWPGEDTGFFSKCKEAGIRCYVDTTLETPHCSETFVTERTFRDYVAQVTSG